MQVEKQDPFALSDSRALPATMSHMLGKLLPRGNLILGHKHPSGCGLWADKVFKEINAGGRGRIMKTLGAKLNHAKRASSSRAHPSIYPLKEHYERDGGRRQKGDGISNDGCLK